MELKIFVNRILIVLDSYFKGHQARPERIDKNVLIIFQQAFGDSVVLQNSLFEYIKLYP